MLHHAQNAFNAGALSPYTRSRPELDVYQNGLQTCVNFSTLPYGGARYRPGTELISQTKSGEACLFGFEFSTEDRHILEFGENYIRFYNTGLSGYGPILDGGVPLEVVTPYLASELKGLQFAQLNDVVIITHPNHAPQRLSRFAFDDWVFEPFPFKNPPFLDINDNSGNRVEADANTGTVTLTSVEDVWTADNVGSEYELAYRRVLGETSVDQPIVNDTTTVKRRVGRWWTTDTVSVNVVSPTIRVQGTFVVQTFGTWDAVVEIQRRKLGEEDFSTYLEFKAASDRNVNEEYTIDEDSEMRIVISDWVSSTDARAVLSVTDPFIRGRVKITGYTGPQEVTGTVLNQLAEGPATEWAESAFSARRGYPRAVTFHGQRLWLAGTKHQRQMVYASRIDGFDDFARPFGTDQQGDADAPLAIPVFAEEQNRIQWMSSNRALLVGTTAGEFVIAGERTLEAIEPQDFTIRRHTSNGSEHIQPLALDKSVLYVQRQRRRLRKIHFVFEEDSYSSPDLSVYNEHLTRSGIVELAFQRQREPVVWAVTGDGRLVGWTYRADQPFLAGHEHNTPGGLFESVAVVYGEGDEDELWVVVNRGGTRYVERFSPDQVQAQEENELSKLWFLDAAVEYSGATATCTGLGHLEGMEVMIFADDSFAGRATVSGGEIENPKPTAERTLVGLFFPGEVETMPIEVQTENGSSQGRMKKSGRGTMRLYKSLTGEWFTSQNPNTNKFRSLNPQTPTVTARDLQDFDEVIESHAGATRVMTVGARQTHPYPMTILGVSTRLSLLEDA